MISTVLLMTNFEKTILKELRELKEMLLVEDLINEKEAANLLGISVRTIQIYASRGKMAGTFTLNHIGNRMYYKSKLVRKRI